MVNKWYIYIIVVLCIMELLGRGSSFFFFISVSGGEVVKSIISFVSIELGANTCLVCIVVWLLVALIAHNI